MSYGSEDDLVREYEMIWTLFNSKDDAVEEEAGCACGPQDGITVRILKFLFGSDRQQDKDDSDNYDEKRPFHRHIHQPATRSRDKPLGTETDTTKAGAPGSDGVNKRLQAEMESSLVARASLDMPGPEGFHPGIAPGRSAALYERLFRLLYALVMGAIIMAASTSWKTVKNFLWGGE